jgi:hypothetical protein
MAGSDKITEKRRGGMRKTEQTTSSSEPRDGGVERRSRSAHDHGPTVAIGSRSRHCFRNVAEQALTFTPALSTRRFMPIRAARTRERIPGQTLRERFPPTLISQGLTVGQCGHLMARHKVNYVIARFIKINVSANTIRTGRIETHLHAVGGTTQSRRATSRRLDQKLQGNGFSSYGPGALPEHGYFLDARRSGSLSASQEAARPSLTSIRAWTSSPS